MTDYIKLSAEVLTIQRDVSHRLADGETISSVSVAYVPNDGTLPIGAQPAVISDTEYEMQRQSGTVGVRYELTATLTTSDSNTLLDTFSILVR